MTTGPHQACTTHVESEVYEWDKPPIRNGRHVYDKGALHLVRVKAKRPHRYRIRVRIGRDLLKHHRVR